MSWQKWLLGGLGFVLGGPIGAVIGVVLASLFEPDEKSIEETNSAENQYKGRATQGDLRMSLLVLISVVIKADGHVKKSELDAVKRYLRNNYDEEEGKEALQILKGLLEQTIDYRSVSRQIKEHVNYSVRLEILHFLLDLAHSDDEFDYAEQQVISEIALHLGISQLDYMSLLSFYKTKENKNWVYEALEIEESATDEEVKRAYRRMAMKYHPDKVASAGDDVKQKATEKFRKINEAYETIKLSRGIK